MTTITIAAVDLAKLIDADAAKSRRIDELLEHCGALRSQLRGKGVSLAHADLAFLVEGAGGEGDRLNDDEMAPIVDLARRIRMGRSLYGPLDLDAAAGRDWLEELHQELLDAVAYGVWRRGAPLGVTFGDPKATQGTGVQP